MAINQNHLFDELDGIKCAIIEKNCKPERVEFLKKILLHNGYTVVVVKNPPPKVAAHASPDAPPAPTPPDTYTVGVTDLTFNATNAIFGKQLLTADGHIVTPNYWKQKDSVSHDEVPYYEKLKA